MKRKHSHNYRNFAVGAVAAFAMVSALLFCISMMHSINQRMNESATSNLLNTTKVIENNMEHSIEKDFQSLKVVGEIYKSGVSVNSEEATALCEAMGFDWIGIADAEGNGEGSFSEGFKAQELPCYNQWKPGERGFSDAYYGETGRLQATLWVPVYDRENLIGTMFGNVILSKYYSANVFTFYEGAGRTYLFDSTGGKLILKSLGTDGASKRQEDIYSLLLSSGNAPEEVKEFQRAVEAGKTGTALFDFNGEKSYICFMPLSSSQDWYISTVIARDALLKESTQVQQMIQMVLIVFCSSLIFFVVTFAVWQIRKTKISEAEYRDALFANISSHIDSALLIYEKKGRKAVFVSENVKRLLGLDREWLEADAGHLFDWCRIDKNDSKRIAFLDGALSQPASCEVCIENELGVKARHIRLELIPADLGQEIAAITDITKDKDVQSSLIDAMQRAEAASRAKNDFLSAMSHDIRTPMNGIIGMAAIAAANLDDPNRIKGCLAKINDASAHLLSIINEILDMSRIESGKMELSEEPFNLAELLQEALNTNFPGIHLKGHTIKVHISAMKHEQVIGDPGHLQRIVDNLISNAIKYTPEGGRIAVSLQEKPPVIEGYGCYEIIVQDNGIGMGQEFQKKIFQPFEREEDVRISKIQGTGLGMPIVKNIVSLMMGDIQVESEKNKGSIFRVTINLKLDEQERQLKGRLAKLPALIVDDDRETCKSVSNMLYDIGMVGEWADNGPLAVKKAAGRHQRGEDYLAVLLDWKMPGIDGVETARRIRAEVDSKVPIIILTAYDWSEIELEAREAGVDSFLSKPLYKTKLRRKMLTLADSCTDIEEWPAEAVCSRIPEGKRILLAEDNELNMEVAAGILAMLKIETSRAENGAAAVEMFANSPAGTYDLILMDIQMPEMNGYEAAQAIRKLNRPDSGKIPIVAMTADAFAQDIQAAYAAGMNEHIAKPVSVERLIQVISYFLSEAAPEQEGVLRDDTKV